MVLLLGYLWNYSCWKVIFSMSLYDGFLLIVHLKHDWSMLFILNVSPLFFLFKSKGKIFMICLPIHDPIDLTPSMIYDVILILTTLAARIGLNFCYPRHEQATFIWVSKLHLLKIFFSSCLAAIIKTWLSTYG